MKFLLPLIFIGVPIAEIAMFIEVGDLIGLWPTLATIVGTAVIGTAILRYQGLAVLARAQGSIDDGRVPIDSVVHGLFLLIAGVLLLTPGFLTDAVGFVLLVPPVRLAIARWLLERLRRSDGVHFQRFDISGFASGTSGRPDQGDNRHGPVIEGEVIRKEEDETAPDEGPSPWQR